MWKLNLADSQKNCVCFLMTCFVLVSVSGASASALKVKNEFLNEEKEHFQDNFPSSAVADAFEITMHFSAENLLKTVQVKSACTSLSDVELEKYRKQFYFGKGLGNEAPTCLVRRLDVTLNGIRQYIPAKVIQMFADGPIFSTVNSAGTNKVFMLVFKGGSGTGSYEARLSFRNNRLVKRQVWGLEPAQTKFKHMVSQFK